MYIVTVDELYFNSIEYADKTDIGSKRKNKIMTALVLVIDFREAQVFKDLHECQKVKNKIKLFDHRNIEIKELTESGISK